LREESYPFVRPSGSTFFWTNEKFFRWVCREFDWFKKYAVGRTNEEITTIKSNGKIIEDGDILVMTWVDLNIVQLMTLIHTVEDLRTNSYKNPRRCHEISTNSIVIVRKNEEEKFPFFISIVKYNQHMSKSNENAQKRPYYSFVWSDRRYCWSLFIFLLNKVMCHDLASLHTNSTH
jgi:hypothetical protein